MSRTRDLFTQHPYLAGSRDAEAWSKTYADHYDRELAGDQLFAAKPGQSVEDRIRLSKSHDVAPGLEDLNNYVQSLKVLRAMTDAINKGQVVLLEERDILAKYLATVEHRFPKVSAIMTVEYAAATAEGWN